MRSDALKTDVLVVLLDAQRMSTSTSAAWDEAKVCEELWFDPVIEAPKKRVFCIVGDMGHFELVVRLPEARFIFDLGADWDAARRVLLAFIKQRVPGFHLEPPVGSAFAISLAKQPKLHESVTPCPPLFPFYNCRSIKAGDTTPSSSSLPNQFQRVA